uniref:Uncharacterized protein n=1 Tax=Anopheles minimus TaxID=112268 RepID=A0A182W9E2_9DIPT
MNKKPALLGCWELERWEGGDKGARTTTLEDTLFRLSKLRERLKAMLRSPAHLIGHGPGAGGGGVVGLHSHASSPPHARPSLFDSCHRKIRLIGVGPVAFLGGLVASIVMQSKVLWVSYMPLITMFIIDEWRTFRDDAEMKQQIAGRGVDL